MTQNILFSFFLFVFFKKGEENDGKVSMYEEILRMLVEPDPDLLHGNLCAAALLVLYLALQLYLRTAM